jgi:hypothetical protein
LAAAKLIELDTGHAAAEHTGEQGVVTMAH